MTEPIIINGVDVSECIYQIKYPAIVFCELSNDWNTKECNCHSDCYYKQLKRTQQELQQAMDNYVKATNYYEDKLAQIKRIIEAF